MTYKIHETVLMAVEAAREKQIRKHGDMRHDIDISNGDWALITGEEFGEWCLSLLQHKTDDWDNAAHLAACAVAFMESRLLSASSHLLPKTKRVEDGYGDDI